MNGVKQERGEYKGEKKQQLEADFEEVLEV